MFKNAIIKGTFILTVTGFVSRLIGFFFRMFLSHAFGEEQVGLYQLIFPIYALCFSLTSAGIEIALSRCVAKKIVCGKKREADTLLYQSLFFSVSLSIILSILLQRGATFLSIYILGDLRCEELLRMLSLSLPFASVHSCICGYYLGQKKTKIPAVSQLVEQLGRVIFVYLIYQVLSSNHSRGDILLAVLGIAVGELLSALFCVRYYHAKPHTRFSLPDIVRQKNLSQELFSLALPLTSNRVLMNVLQSVETISIPLCLQKYGHTNTEALSIYGVLFGMVIPCVFFPTAITNSVSTMLLPTVAQIQAEDNLIRLKQLIQKVIFFGFGLGTICGSVFLLLGSFIGTTLFDSTLAGDFLQTLAFLCPFLYMNNTLISILNGLGKANSSFAINISGLTIRIMGVWIGIAYWGMKGYLWGLMGSQLLVSLFCITALKLYVEKRELS